jgi:ABC-type glycerol-3-phosphate transport system substrate-binding protein
MANSIYRSSRSKLGNTAGIWLARSVGPLATATVIALGCLAGCESASSSTTVLTVYTGQGWNFMTIAARNFEKTHPGVVVQLSQTSGQPYFNNLPRTLPTSSTPDITVLQVIPGPYDAVIKQNELISLNSIWTQLHLASHYPLSLVKNYRAHGTYYGIPIDLLWMPIFWFNESLLAELHLPVPTTHQWPSLQAFTSWESAVVKTGHEALTSGITDDDGAAFVFSTLLDSSCGNPTFHALESDAMVRSGHASWTASCVSNALFSLQAIELATGAPSFPSTMSDNEASALFESQRSAGFSTGSWEASAVAQDHVRFRIAWTLPPPARDGTTPEMMVADLDALGINSRSSHVALAKEFLSYLASPQFESIAKVQAELPGPPPRTDVPFSNGVPELNLQQDKFIQAFGSQTQLTTAVPFEATIEQLLVEYLSGHMDAQSVEEHFQVMALNGTT